MVRRIYVLRADVYAAIASAVTSDGRAAGRARENLNLVDYVRRVQPGSDITQYTLADSAFQSGRSRTAV